MALRQIFHHGLVLSSVLAPFDMELIAMVMPLVCRAERRASEQARSSRFLAASVPVDVAFEPMSFTPTVNLAQRIHRNDVTELDDGRMHDGNGRCSSTSSSASSARGLHGADL
jgi:hypothetical protein